MVSRALCLFAVPALLASGPAPLASGPAPLASGPAPLASGPAPLPSGPGRQAPWAAWQTMATAHYRIHYPPDLAEWAREVAGRIEAIHAGVVAQVGYQAPGPIQVLLGDPVGEPNGMAVPLLGAPYVVLWRTEPLSDSQLGGSMSRWSDTLLTHELTHIHHLSWPRRLPEGSGARSLFSLPLGPLLLKSPRWLIEGYATLVEGRVTGHGRPHSSFRAAVLRQWASAGKLPPYAALNRKAGYLGSSMAYLVGSAYLEWLERQRPDQPDILQRLWKHLAREHRSFEAGFLATFGFGAEDGYQRFQAEAGHDALEWEARLKAQGLREGALWLRVAGGVADLGVSPDGAKLLARLVTERDPGLRVWSLASPPPPAAAPTGAADSFNAAADAPAPFTPPTLLASLPSLDHQAPEKAQWLDDRTIRFELKRPDREGTLRRQPECWRPGALAQAGPGPVPVPGRILLPVHRSGSWVLEMDGQVIPLPGPPAGRAWVDAGREQIFAACDLDGIWNLVRVPYRSEPGGPRFEAPQRLTRTLGAAWNPAPTPDGKGLFYTSLDARGMEIRRLDLDQPPLAEAPAAEPRVLAPDAVTAPAPGPGIAAAPAATPPSVPYRAADNLWNHLTAGLSFTPSGQCYQLGVAGSDLLDRLSWQAVAGLGDGAGPRGAMLGLYSSAHAWKPSLSLFSALERPGRQSTPAPGDQERRGAEWALAYDRQGTTRFWLSPVLAWERIAPLAPRPDSHGRGLAGLRVGLAALWARGPWGLGLNPALDAYQGRSRAPWNAQRASLRLRLETPVLPLTLRGEHGRFRGDPGEAFHLGGVTTTLVPESLDLDRLVQPALPARSASGDRFLRWRGELGSLVRLYAEGTALWNAGQERGPFQRVLGLEGVLDTRAGTGSEQVLKRMQVRMGLHRPLDGATKGRTVATLTLMLRP